MSEDAQDTQQTRARAWPDWAEPFLKELAKNGNVSESCIVAGKGRRTIYDLRDRDPRFAEAMRLSRLDACDALRREAIRRAVAGVDEEHTTNRGDTYTITRYSDRLLEFLMKADHPEKYGNKVAVDQKTEHRGAVAGIAGLDQLSPEGQSELRQLLEREAERQEGDPSES